MEQIAFVITIIMIVLYNTLIGQIDLKVLLVIESILLGITLLLTLPIMDYLKRLGPLTIERTLIIILIGTAFIIRFSYISKGRKQKAQVLEHHEL